MNQNNFQRGQLPIILLSTLLDGDKYGLEIIQCLKEKTNNELNIKQPTLYSSLTRMEKQGLISSYWRESDLGGKRHYYSLTDLGKKHFSENESTFFADFKQKTAENRTTIAQNQKYDEIGHFQDKNDKLFVENNETKENKTKIIKNIDNELNLLPKTTTSFSENLKENNTYENYESETYVLPPENQNIKIENQSLKENDFPINNDNFLQNDNLETDINIQIQKQKININEENFETQNLLPNVDPQDVVETDGGIFIQEKFTPDQIPVVKKIETAHIETFVQSPLTSKLQPKPNATYEEQIKSLYEKTKPKDLSAKQQNYNETYKQLKEFYASNDIKFCVNGDKKEQIKENTLSEKSIPNKEFFKKHMLVFCLVLIETLICTLFFYYSKGSIAHYYILIAVPILFLFAPIYYLFNKKTSHKNKLERSFIYSFLIFIVAIVLLYSLNMLIGMNLENIANFETTFIYPAIILTNIFVFAIYDNLLLKKYNK